jgi:hypothetical protein
METPVSSPGRVCQLRIYESPSAKTGLKKIEMFNDAGAIKIFRAVAATGSVRRAGAQLKVSHSTVSRRLDALEHDLGVRLFDRLPGGYQPTPAGAEILVSDGHTVFIEAGAGLGSGFPDEAYTAVGAQILATADEVLARAEMIMKVKEPIAVEWPRMRKGQIIYTYFHFAAAEELTRAVIASGAIAVAYETVQLPSGELPLLTPMSEVAGRMAVQEGAKYLEKLYGGRGVLLGGVPGVAPAEVVIIGAAWWGSTPPRWRPNEQRHHSGYLAGQLHASTACCRQRRDDLPTGTTSSSASAGRTWWSAPCW